MNTDLHGTIVPVLADHYPELGLGARWAHRDGMLVFDITMGDAAICWIDGDVFTQIAKGDEDALEIVFDEIDNALKQCKQRGN